MDDLPADSILVYAAGTLNRSATSDGRPRPAWVNVRPPM